MLNHTNITASKAELLHHKIGGPKNHMQVPADKEYW